MRFSSGLWSVLMAYMQRNSTSIHAICHCQLKVIVARSTHRLQEIPFNFKTVVTGNEIRSYTLERKEIKMSNTGPAALPLQLSLGAP